MLIYNSEVIIFIIEHCCDCSILLLIAIVNLLPRLARIDSCRAAHVQDSWKQSGQVEIAVLNRPPLGFHALLESGHLVPGRSDGP